MWVFAIYLHKMTTESRCDCTHVVQYLLSDEDVADLVLGMGYNQRAFASSGPEGLKNFPAT